MLDTYALVKEAICALLQTGAQLDAAPSDIFCAAAAGEASTALPLAFHIPAESLALRLNSFNRAQQQTFYGVKLVERVFECDGRLCFSLTDAFFDAAVRELNAKLPLPTLPDHTESRAQYALCRMLMLAKKSGDGCTKEARPMVWSALGILEKQNDKKALKIRLMLAAEHALEFAADIPLRERMALYEKNGAAGACAARCLALGLDALGR
ncbi:MAG TPA: hypothetical protein VN512_02035 [Clostridia bacterium]|nr:hypothetical protein [Clostridia bacterium]